MKSKEKEFEGKVVKINLVDRRFFTVKVSKQTADYIQGTDKFGCPVWFNFKTINYITPVEEKHEN